MKRHAVMLLTAGRRHQRGARMGEVVGSPRHRTPAGVRQRFGLLVGTMLLTGAAAWSAGCSDRPFEPGTGSVVNGRRVLQPGTPVAGTLASSSDTARYVIRTPGEWLRIFLQARSTRAQDTLFVLVRDSARRAPPLTAESAGSDLSLTLHGTHWFRVTEDNPVFVDVFARTPDSSGPYELLLYPRNALPETRTARFQVGDTVAGEAMDVTGDVDDFYFRGQAGDELILFLEQPGVSGARMKAVLTDSSSNAEHVSAETSGEPNLLLDRWSQVFRVPADRTYRVQVGGYTPFFDWRYIESDAVGPYRFLVARVNRTPERTAALIAVGDTCSDAVDHPGDIDEYRFTGVAGTELNVLLQAVSGLHDGLDLELLQGEGAGERVLARANVTRPTTTLDSAASGRLRLPENGEFRVRIAGSPRSGPVAATTGTYRFALYPINRQPEQVPVLTPIGTDILTEAIDRPGDVDEFVIPAAPGRDFAVELRTFDASPAAWSLEILRGDTVIHIATATDRWSSPPPGAGIRTYTTMLPAPETGTYVARVQAPDLSFGRYELYVYSLSGAPETVPTTVVAGVPVTGERIERVMDLDTFTFAGVAGQEINVFLRRDPGYTGQLWLLFQPAWLPRYQGAMGYNQSVAYGESSTLDSSNIGRLKLPATGTYKIYVDGFYPSTSAEPGAGPYSFLIFPINTQPETRAAAVAIGDTVREAIYPSGDVDEYTFTGAVGDRLTVRLGGDTPAVQCGVDVEVLGPDGVGVIRQRIADRTYDVDLLQDGSYTLRVAYPDHSWTPGGYCAGDYWLWFDRR